MELLRAPALLPPPVASCCRSVHHGSAGHERTPQTLQNIFHDTLPPRRLEKAVQKRAPPRPRPTPVLIRPSCSPAPSSLPRGRGSASRWAPRALTATTECAETTGRRGTTEAQRRKIRSYRYPKNIGKRHRTSWFLVCSNMQSMYVLNFLNAWRTCSQTAVVVDTTIHTQRLVELLLNTSAYRRDSLRCQWWCRWLFDAHHAVRGSDELGRKTLGKCMSSRATKERHLFLPST